jgi:alkylated DNA repair dioxygenase AlkB
MFPPDRRNSHEREQARAAMNQKNILPYDGLVYVSDNTEGEFEWPKVTACLAETVPWRIETARLFGRNMPVPRMTACFGDADYTYSGIRHRAASFPAVVQRLRERAEAISGGSYNAVLLNLYRDGNDSVGWHSDREAALGNYPTITSLSLGATRRFQFRHRRQRRQSRLNSVRAFGWSWLRDSTLLGSPSAENYGGG